jgi:hypothetical protein
MARKRYGNKRSADLNRTPETVTSPSQKAMLQVFEKSLSMPFIPSVSRGMTAVVISSSVVGIDALRPVVAIYQQHSLVHCSVDERGKNTDVGKDILILNATNCFAFQCALTK